MAKATIKAKIVNPAKATKPTSKRTLAEVLAQPRKAQEQEEAKRKAAALALKKPAEAPYVQSKLSPHKDKPHLQTLGKDASPKAAKQPKAPSTRGKADYADSAKITVVNKDCPHKAASGRALHFSKVLAAKTVGDYLGKGGKGKYLPKWAQSGHIKIA